MNIFRKKNRTRRKLLGSYDYRGLKVNVFMDKDNTVSIWIEHSNQADCIFKFEELHKKELKHRLKMYSTDLQEILADCYGDFPMTDDQFEQYLNRILPYIDEQD